MAKQLWFGVPTKKMQWVPAPLAGGEAINVGFVDSMLFENGGTAIERSSAFHKQYQFEFNAPLKGSEGLNVFNKFASGFYGTGLIYFADPYIFESNVLPAHWASPGLVELGWPGISVHHNGYADTSANSYDQPLRSALFNLTDGTGAPEMPYRCIIVIPPTHTLHLGFSGSATGNGVVQVRPVNTDGTYASTSNLTLLDPTASTRMNATFAGSSYQAVEVYFTRSSSGASTLTIASAMAQLWPTGTTPTLTGGHIPGEGHTGLKFSDNARPETYSYINPPRKALSTTLTEVGAWT
jgi:hypothetical protein